MATCSAATIEAPAEFKYTFKLTVAPRALELAPVGDFVASDAFEGGGHKWQLRVYLGGKNDEAKGNSTSENWLFKRGEGREKMRLVPNDVVSQPG